MSESVIPVIDYASLSEQSARFALDDACRKWGFFQLINHEIPAGESAKLLDAMGSFFSLPQSEKAKLSRTDQNPWGFFDQELTKNTPDWKEIFDYGPEYGDTHRPVWPEQLPEFREAVEAFYQHCETLAFELTEVIGAVLGASPGMLSRLFQPVHTSFVRANYYPVCPNPESPADISTPAQGHQGINHHTDAGLLTILLQDSAPGLEVYKAGSWHLVEPLADALVINIGDIAQVLSNDRYHAALHRVRASSTYERYSVPFFFNPSYSASYQPLRSVVETGERPLYSAINWGEFRASRAAGDYADVGEEIQISDFRLERAIAR